MQLEVKMYKNFLEETVLTGRITDIYLDDMPNNLLIQQSHDYVLSIQNTQFIGKLTVEDIQEVNTKIFNLSLTKDSSDLIIDWGDSQYTQIVTINCKQSNQLKQNKDLRIGDCYYNSSEKQYYIFTGTEFNKCQYKVNNIHILPSQLVKQNQALILRTDDRILGVEIINMDSYNFMHTYQSGIYYFKIKGNLTGFNTSGSNNGFYKSIKIEDIDKPYIYLTEILSWGENTNWNTLTNAFNNAKKLKSIPFCQMPNVNDAISCFYNCVELELPKNKNLLPNALIYGTSMFQNSGINGDISYLNIPPYNTVTTKMFKNTRITSKPNNFQQKTYFNKDQCFSLTLINQN